MSFKDSASSIVDIDKDGSLSSSAITNWPLLLLASAASIIYIVAIPFISIPFKNQKLGGGAPYIGTFPIRQQTIFKKLDAFPYLKVPFKQQCHPCINIRKHAGGTQRA